MVEASKPTEVQPVVVQPVLGLELGSHLAKVGMMDDGPDIKILEAKSGGRKTPALIKIPFRKPRQIGQQAA